MADLEVSVTSQGSNQAVIGCYATQRARHIQCFANWLSMCKVEMALINISSSN